MPKLPAFELSICLLVSTAVPLCAQTPDLRETRVQSTVDGVAQPVRYWVPPRAEMAAPLLVSLHSWSADYTQDRSEWLVEAVKRNWVYIQPNFRGPNDDPQACGSLRARRDVLDAIDWALAEFRIDTSRVYLCGVSGGGHMTMLMVGYYPQRFSAATAWVGISDLAGWYRFHAPDGVEARYARMISASCGGPPGSSASADVEYFRRSPIHFLKYAGEVPLDLNTGVRDGQEGSVPIHHTLRAYNEVLRGRGEGDLISDAEMESLWKYGRLRNPRPEDAAGDTTYPRNVVLRRTAGPTRVTVFDGGHEALPSAACQWLEKQVRLTRQPPEEDLP